MCLAKKSPWCLPRKYLVPKEASHWVSTEMETKKARVPQGKGVISRWEGRLKPVLLSDTHWCSPVVELKRSYSSGCFQISHNVSGSKAAELEMCPEREREREKETFPQPPWWSHWNASEPTHCRWGCRHWRDSTGPKTNPPLLWLIHGSKETTALLNPKRSWQDRAVKTLPNHILHACCCTVAYASNEKCWEKREKLIVHDNRWANHDKRLWNERFCAKQIPGGGGSAFSQMIQCTGI